MSASLAPHRYTGATCATDVDECTASTPPCRNGGSCADSSSDPTVPAAAYSCTCAAGFAGTICESDFDECGSEPCGIGARCDNGAGFYSCACAVPR